MVWKDCWWVVTPGAVVLFRSSGGDDSDEDKPRMSRFKGVCWYRQRRKWQASIYLSGGKKKHLGRSSESMPSSPRHAEGGALGCVVQGISSRRWTVSTNWVAMVGRGTTRLPATRPDVLLSPHVVVLSLPPPGALQLPRPTTGERLDHPQERTNERGVQAAF